MDHDRSDRGAGTKPSRKTIWIIAGVLIALLVLVSLYGIVAASGDAAGVDKMAPGGDNTAPHESG